MNNDLLRHLPKVDKVLTALNGMGHGLPDAIVLNSARLVLEKKREGIKSGRVVALSDFDALLQEIVQYGRESRKLGIHRVINATGIVLHTNLGRAPLGDEIAELVKQAVIGYNTLEYDLETGRRGRRGTDIERLLKRLTGCEDAVVVNNNAAAVLLVLSALCQHKRVICSRGELVEIGGAFRIPEVISQGGAVLTEVGTTNKTRLSDYAAAVDEDTAAILKVHTSNYRITGFTEEVRLSELAPLARDCGIPLIYDLGGGALTPLHESEPTVQEALAAGADLLCFSGDKLLGASQAGVIIGRAQYVTRLKAHPLYRALRMDKLTLAALEATLKLYEEGRNEEIPALSMLSRNNDDLKQDAEELLKLIVPKPSQFNAEIVETVGQAGGGSLPAEDFPSYAVAISPVNMPLHELERKLRHWHMPIIARIHRERLLLDIRTVSHEDFHVIAAAISGIFEQ